jgi:hypothetical protein
VIRAQIALMRLFVQESWRCIAKWCDNNSPRRLSTRAPT